MSVVLLLLSCATHPAGTDVDPTAADAGGAEGGAADEAVEPGDFDPVAALARASLDSRGIRPTADEIAAIEADPDSYEEVVESFLSDERFGGRVRELFSEVYLTRKDSYSVTADDYGLSDEVGFATAVGDEPLHILSRIVEEDLPYYEIVTADWTMADENLGAAFPVDYPDGATGWQVVQYTDGRPAAGVLSTNGMWWRYTSTDSNANRGRANAVSKILLCQDYLSKPIEFDRNVNLLDSDALSDALQNNPGCVACHSTLDPLASYFYGFYHYLYYSKLELTNYHAEREQWWEDATGIAPGYYGEAGWTLSDLGQQIASDPRLVQCATQQVFELMLQRDAEISDDDTLTAWREDFLADGLTMRTLFREALTSDEYKLRVDARGDSRVKMLTPDQLASTVEDLTGFRFTYGGYDLLGSDTYGVRTLAGGVDGEFATTPASEPTATITLVHERIGQAAAWHAVEAEAADRGSARLFTEIDFTESPSTDRDAMVSQIQRLHLLLFGRHIAPDGPEVEANLELWEALEAVEGSHSAAWAGLLSVLFRDPDFLFY